MVLSFWKAEQLLALATLVAARHAGVTLDDVIERFSVSKRTAQRMMRALEAQFTDTNVSTDGEGRKRWHLPSGALRDLMSLSPEELAALDIAIETLKRSGLAVEADDLLSLREKILALVPRSKAARLETDHEALLEAQGLAARPGPRQRVDRKVAAAVAEAIKACRILEVEYQSRDEPAPRMRRLAPYSLRQNCDAICSLQRSGNVRFWGWCGRVRRVAPTVSFDPHRTIGSLHSGSSVRFDVLTQPRPKPVITRLDRLRSDRTAARR